MCLRTISRPGKERVTGTKRRRGGGGHPSIIQIQQSAPVRKPPPCPMVNGCTGQIANENCTTIAACRRRQSGIINHFFGGMFILGASNLNGKEVKIRIREMVCGGRGQIEARNSLMVPFTTFKSVSSLIFIHILSRLLL
jgi:hypothetical protein